MEIIHIVLGKANPDRLNGVNKVVYNMASEQVKAGKKVSVWGITKDIQHNYPERIFNTTLFKSHWFPFRIHSELKIAIVENKQAVFHLHGGWIPVFSSLARLFTKHQIKFVLTPHGAYNTLAMKKNSWLKKFYFSFFEKQLVQKAHKIHSTGKSEITGLNSIYKNANNFLLPYGFDFEESTGSILKNDSFTIGFVGRLDTYTKGLDLLVEAFYEFQKSQPNSKLWIIGDGEGRLFIEKFIQEKKLQNVILWGKKFGKEKDDLIRKMHVFAHPSRNEGLPTAVLEAMSLGVPTIVTEATNIADDIRIYKSGIAIADNNVSELHQAMEQLYVEYNQAPLAMYAQNGKTMLREKFYWPVLVEKFEELYR